MRIVRLVHDGHLAVLQPQHALLLLPRHVLGPLEVGHFRRKLNAVPVVCMWRVFAAGPGGSSRFKYSSVRCWRLKKTHLERSAVLYKRKKPRTRQTAHQVQATRYTSTAFPTRSGTGFRPTGYRPRKGEMRKRSVHADRMGGVHRQQRDPRRDNHSRPLVLQAVF